jgi:hypothetical protein
MVLKICNYSQLFCGKGIVGGMIPDSGREKLETLSREELHGLIAELMDKIRDLDAGMVRLKQPPVSSRNSSQPSARDFKASASKKCKRSRTRGAKAGHEKQERPLVDNPNKVIEVYAEQCEACQINLLDQMPLQIIHRSLETN